MEQIRHLQLALLFSASGVALSLYSIVLLIHDAPHVSVVVWAALIAMGVFDYMGWSHLRRAER